MRIAVIIMAAMFIGNIRGAVRIPVYVDPNSVPREVVYRAKHVCTQMLATAGVAIDWRADGPGADQTLPGRPIIEVKFSMNTSSAGYPGALAYARPREGIHIVVFYDRILTRTSGNSALRSLVLAHVMAHEIGHVLQRADNHSPTGIMKAQWDASDFGAMMFSPLRFTPGDIDRIRRGLQLREARQAGEPML